MIFFCCTYDFFSLVPQHILLLLCKKEELYLITKGNKLVTVRSVNNQTALKRLISI